MSKDFEKDAGFCEISKKRRMELDNPDCRNNLLRHIVDFKALEPSDVLSANEDGAAYNCPF